MIQCVDCEHYHRGEDGEIGFSCDPFTTILEPECLAKWQLIKMNQLVAGYQSTVAYYERFAPMQEKMFRMMEREMDDMSEADQWKYEEDDDNNDNDNDNDENEPWRESL